MPHKRAKKSVRDSNRDSRGHDLAPTSQSSEKVSKTIYRILNAESIRNERRKRKAEALEKGDSKKQKLDSASTSSLKPAPHESLTNFYRRVDQELRPDFIQAAQKSLSIGTQEKKKKQQLNKEKRRKAEEERELEEARKATSKANWRRSDKSLPGGVFVKDSKGKLEVSNGAKSMSSNQAAVKLQSSSEQIKQFADASRVGLHDIVEAPPELPRLKLPEGHGSSDSMKVRAHQLPIGLGMKKMMEEERERAIALYREMKEKKMAEKRSTIN